MTDYESFDDVVRNVDINANLVATNNKLTIENETLKSERDRLLLAKENLRLTTERQTREITELRRALLSCRDSLVQALTPLSRYVSLDQQSARHQDPPGSSEAGLS